MSGRSTNGSGRISVTGGWGKRHYDHFRCGALRTPNDRVEFNVTSLRSGPNNYLPLGNAMKFRRHHNSDGRRQIKNGGTGRKMRWLAKALGIPYGRPTFGDDSVPAPPHPQLQEAVELGARAGPLQEVRPIVSVGEARCDRK